MANRTYKTAAAFLAENGYEYDRTNAKGVEFWTRAGCHELAVPPWMDDQKLRMLRRDVQRAVGAETDKDRSKRNASAIKERQAGDRERAAAEAARHETQLNELIAKRDRRMDSYGQVLTGREMRDIERLIEQKHRDLRYWQSLMTEVPTTNAHSGRATAQHRA